MREETDEKEEEETKTSNSGIADTTELEVTTKVAAWQEQQKKGKSGNWARDQIKTFGKTIAKSH